MIVSMYFELVDTDDDAVDLYTNLNSTDDS